MVALWDAVSAGSFALGRQRSAGALSEYVQEELGSPDAVLVLDETGFLKKGIHSAGSAAV